MKTRDIATFMEENETPEVRAFDHAVDLEFLILDEMEKQGINKTELARRMGISAARLSTLLNTQPNMTLETIASFELALGIDLAFEVKHKEKEKEMFLVPYEAVAEEDEHIDDGAAKTIESKKRSTFVEPKTTFKKPMRLTVPLYNEDYRMEMAA